MENGRNKKATQEGADKAAEAYADNREISVQDGAGYPFKEEIMRAFIVGAAWREQRLIDKACDLYCKLCDTKECVDDECNWVKKFRKAMEEQQ